jgi:hypothetical protein
MIANTYNLGMGGLALLCVPLNVYQILWAEKKQTVVGLLPYFFHRTIPFAALLCTSFNVLTVIELDSVNIDFLFLVDACFHVCTLLGMYHIYFMSYLTVVNAEYATTTVIGGLSATRKRTIALVWIAMSVVNTLALIASFVGRALTNERIYIGIFLLRCAHTHLH